jgi:hypothetical protein
MAIQAARGFFRLWLVLSILWVAAVAFQTWRDIPRDDWVLVDLSRPSDDQIAVPAGIFHPVALVVPAKCLLLTQSGHSPNRYDVPQLRFFRPLG